MLLEGVRLMVVGMTTVFAFLGVLVVAMHGTRAVAEQFSEPESPGQPGDQATQDNDRDVAIVLAAVAKARGGA